jgi:cholesterol oxidase
MRDLAAQWKAELRVNPLWAAARKPVTVHQQGGCPMSDRPDEGVVNGWGEVHAYPGLFVFDGAALPRAVGVNPSSTIAALAERNVEHFVTTCKLPGIAWRLDDGEPQRIAAWKKRAAGWALEPVGAVAHPFQSKPIGIKFTEVMTGFHAPLPRQDKLTHGLLDRLNIDRRARTPHPRLDVSPEPGEYEAAYRRGCPVNVLSLTMHAFMEDIVAFEADRDHRMAMTGDVVLRWPERGIDCKASFDAGSYASLFVPLRFEQGVGKDRFMLYDLSFEEPSGPRWYVLGFKRMHIGEGTGAWADTTNLFVTVWCPERDLITEGVARLPMETLLYETMGELEVTGTEDPARRAWAIATFGAVFFGHLGEIYLPALRRYQALLGGQLLKRRS